MAQDFAGDFFDIPSTLADNGNLREAVVALILNESMPGKVLEGDDRLDVFRTILVDLANGNINMDDAYRRTQMELSHDTSPHSSNNRVFAEGWAERLVRIQFSRFYNQAVLEQLRDEEITVCFVPHSEAEDISSPCTRLLAGQQQSVDMLYQRLINAYAQGNWSREVKIPNHPHCTHVVTPIEE